MATKRRKGNNYLARFQEAEEQHKAEQEKNEEEQVEEDTVQEDTVSAEKHFQNVMSEASPGDILAEYLWFKRNLIPKLLDTVGSKLLMEVRKHLNIDEAKERLCDTSAEKVKPEGTSFPILDSLSSLIGICLRNVMAPPVMRCILCGENLTLLNKPVNVPLHTLSGPQMATKYMYHRVFLKGHFEKIKCPPHHKTGGYLERSYPEGEADQTSLGGRH